MNELTKRQIERQDSVDNCIFEMVQRLNPSDRQIEWDIEMIGGIRDLIEGWLVRHLQITDAMTFYPYIEE